MKNMKIAYGGWIGHNNLGDDAMYEVIKGLIEKNLKIDNTFIAKHYRRLRGYCDLVICGGGTLLTPWGLQWDRFFRGVMKKNIPIIIYGTGIQSLDFYWYYKRGFKKHEKLLVDIVDYAELVGVRGYRSQNILLGLGCKKNIQVIGDPALMCTIKGGKSVIPELVKSDKPKIGISIGRSPNGIFGDDERLLKKEIITFTNYLTKRGFEVVFFTVWPKDHPIQKSVLKSLNSPKNVYAINKVYDISTTLQLIHDLDLLVGQKLHSNVFAAAVGTPFVSLAYRPKCIDFANSVGMDEYIVRTDESLLNLVNVFEKAWEKREDVHYKLIEKRDEYRRKFLRFTRNAVKVITELASKK